MIIMLDEEFDELKSDKTDKTLMERISEIFDKKNSSTTEKIRIRMTFQTSMNIQLKKLNSGRKNLSSNLLSPVWKIPRI